MKPKDKVYIDFQDGDVGTIMAYGIIISSAPAIKDIPPRHCVEYKSNEYPHNLTRQWFYETDLKKVE